MKIFSITSILLCLSALIANAEILGNKSSSEPNSIGGNTISIHGQISDVQETLVYDKTNKLMGRIVSSRKGKTKITTFYRGVSELILTSKHTTSDTDQVNELYTPDGRLAVKATIPKDHDKKPIIQDDSGKNIPAETGQKLMAFPNELLVASLKPNEAK